VGRNGCGACLGAWGWAWKAENWGCWGSWKAGRGAAGKDERGGGGGRLLEGCWAGAFWRGSGAGVMGWEICWPRFWFRFTRSLVFDCSLKPFLALLTIFRLVISASVSPE